MKFKQAYKVIQVGKPIQSLVSKNLYELKGEVLLCEGLPVSNEHLTPQEINGEWQEVTIIDSMEDYQKLSSEEKSRIHKDAYEAYEFQNKYRGEK